MSGDRAPRHVDLDTERVVLGHILAFDAWPAYAQAGLMQEDFWRAAHRHIYAACAALEADDAPVSGVTVQTRLRETARLEDAGGAVYLFGLDEGLPQPDHAMITWCARRLRSLAIARRAADVGQRLAATADIDAATLSATAADLDALVELDAPAGTDAAAQLDALYAARAHERTLSLNLGIPTLDDTLDGLRAGEVCGIMARTSVGKTLVACHIAASLAASGVGVLFVSLEMAAGQIVERMARQLLGCSRHQLRWALDNGRFDADAYRQRFRALHVIDTPGISLQAIERRVRTIQRTQPISVVVIDYLGLVGGDRGASTYDRMSHVSRDLKDVAKRSSVVIVPLIQVSRAGGDDGAQELALGAARDSGVIEEAVDYLIALRRLDRATKLSDVERDRYRDVIFARVVKNRHGSVSVRETAIRVNPTSLALTEDQHLSIDEQTATRTKRQEVRL